MNCIWFVALNPTNCVRCSGLNRLVVAADLGRSMYGWTLRYASGLQGWSIIFASRNHNPATALAEALRWVAVNPECRSVCVSVGEIDRCEADGHDCSVLREAISVVK